MNLLIQVGPRPFIIRYEGELAALLERIRLKSNAVGGV